MKKPKTRMNKLHAALVSAPLLFGCAGTAESIDVKTNGETPAVAVENDSEAANVQGRSLHHQKEYQKAISVYSEGLESAEEGSLIWKKMQYNRALAHRKLGGEDSLQKAEEDSRKLIEEILESDSKEDRPFLLAEGHHILALVLQERGASSDEVIGHYEKALEVDDPKEKEMIRYNLGNYFQIHLKNNDRALEHYNQALSHPKSRLSKAKILKRQGKLAEARPLIETLVEETVDNPELHTNVLVTLSDLHLTEKDWQGAYEVAKRALAIDSKAQYGNWNAMEALVKMEGGDLEEACGFYQKAHALGLEQGRKGDVQELEKTYKPLLEKGGVNCD